MMSNPVEQWLQTFLCSQYARIFDAHGYKSLQSVCFLQLQHLLAMGVPRNHSEKILENVNNLRQTMFGRIHSSSADSDQYNLAKQFPALSQATWAIKSAAMNANYRGMNQQYPDDYSSYGHSSNMSSMGFHQGNYDNSNNMGMISGAGSFVGQGYEGNQAHMLMPSQGTMSTHSAPMYQQQQAYLAQQQYYGGSAAAAGGGQYASQAYSMQGSGMAAMGGSGQYYSATGSQAPVSGTNKMAPPAHHHLRNTSGQQNPQQVADNILQMASSFPIHHTVQVPLKNRHAPYQIPRSPQNYVGQQPGMLVPQQQPGMVVPQQQPGMVVPQHQVQSQQTQMMSSPLSLPGQHGLGTGQMQANASQGAMVRGSSGLGQTQQPPVMYSGSSPHHHLSSSSSPMSPVMQSMSSPAGALSSPSTVVCSPMPSSPSLANMRSPSCSVPLRSPAHMASGYAGQSISSPSQRQFDSISQHCSPPTMHSPASHSTSPYTGLASHVSSPLQHSYSIPPPNSPYSTMDLLDSGQGPGGNNHVTHACQNTCANPLQSLQKLVMLPETQVVDPKSVVSEGCLQNCDEGSKNFEGPAEQSREAVDCSAWVTVVCSPPCPSIVDASSSAVASICSNINSSVKSNDSCASTSAIVVTSVANSAPNLPAHVKSESSCVPSSSVAEKSVESILQVPTVVNKSDVGASASASMNASKSEVISAAVVKNAERSFYSSFSDKAVDETALDSIPSTVVKNADVSLLNMAAVTTNHTAEFCTGTINRSTLSQPFNPSRPTGGNKKKVNKNSSKAKKANQLSDNGKTLNLISSDKSFCKNQENDLFSNTTADLAKNAETNANSSSIINDNTCMIQLFPRDTSKEKRLHQCNGVNDNTAIATAKSDTVSSMVHLSDSKDLISSTKIQAVPLDSKTSLVKETKSLPPATRHSKRLAKQSSPTPAMQPVDSKTTKTECGTNTTESMYDGNSASLGLVASDSKHTLVNGFKDHFINTAISVKETVMEDQHGKKNSLLKPNIGPQPGVKIQNDTKSAVQSTSRNQVEKVPVQTKDHVTAGNGPQTSNPVVCDSNDACSKKDSKNKAKDCKLSPVLPSMSPNPPSISSSNDSVSKKDGKMKEDCKSSPLAPNVSHHTSNPTVVCPSDDATASKECKKKRNDCKFSPPLPSVSRVSGPQADVDDSSSSGLDFGYDSPPCEMLEDAGWRPDMRKGSANGVDEADGSGSSVKLEKDKGSPPAACPSNDVSGRGVKLVAGGDSVGQGSSVSDKVIPLPSRIVTRSSTGKVPKRKFNDDDEAPAPKRIRQHSRISHFRNVVLSVEYEDNPIQKSVDSYVSSSNDALVPGTSAHPKGKNAAATKKTSPVILINKSPVQPKTPQKSPSRIKSTAAIKQQNFYSIRGDKGRFVSRNSLGTIESGVYVSGALNGIKKAGKKEVTSLQKDKILSTPVLTVSIDSDSDTEPLSTVHRHVSGEFAETGTGLNLKTDSSLLLAKLSPSHVTRESSVGKKVPSPVKTIISSPQIGSSFSQSYQQKNADSLSNAVKFEGKSIKDSSETTTKKKSKSKKSVKGKQKKKQFEQSIAPDDTFKSMKLSRTLNHLKQNKKKGDGFQQAGTFSPFVRVHGKQEVPLSVSVFNNPPTDPKDTKFTGQKKTVSSSVVPVGTIPIMNFASDKTVMVPYSKTTDANWICTLCGKRSSYRFLGDLFGPYYLESALPALTATELGKKDAASKPDSLETGPCCDAQNTHITRRRSLQYRRSVSGSGEEASVPQEVWVHEDCALWTSGVYLVGNHIYGLEEALKVVTNTVCASCREKGAMIGCLHKGCNQNFHYMCALDKMCFLDVENFSMLCPKHKDRRTKMVAQSSETL